MKKIFILISSFLAILILFLSIPKQILGQQCQVGNPNPILCTDPDRPCDVCVLPGENNSDCVPLTGSCQLGGQSGDPYCCPESGPAPPGPDPGIRGDCGENAINTAVGCISFEDANAVSRSILDVGIGIGGGIAFVLIIVASFIISTSAGDPKRLQAGKELLTAALSGLLLLIFSVFLLKLLGLQILRIPGF